jgi:hypothetical protein
MFRTEKKSHESILVNGIFSCLPIYSKGWVEY